MFETILMQVTTTGVTTQIVELITAIGAIVIAVGGISHSLAMRPELKAHKAALQGAADFMKDVGGHIIASKEESLQLADVVYNNMPDQGRSIINKQAIRLAELTNKLNKATEQLDKVPGALDHI
jgi:hypothetical protein